MKDLVLPCALALVATVACDGPTRVLVPEIEPNSAVGCYEVTLGNCLGRRNMGRHGRSIH